nr:hypothetical protein [uncultured Ruminococcus sp.]
MTFPNGADGVKKIFTAEILGLIASVCFFITAILTITTVAAAVGASGGSDAAAVGAVASGAGVVVLSLGGLVLSIISFILSLVGINKASRWLFTRFSRVLHWPYLQVFSPATALLTVLSRRCRLLLR